MEIARLTGLLALLISLIVLIVWAGRDLPLTAAKNCPAGIGRAINC